MPLCGPIIPPLGGPRGAFTMSCYLVYTEKAHKMMRPVNTREEYLSLRNAPMHRQNVAMARQGKEGYKKLLMQMNYSCLPTTDDNSHPGCGPLKGCQTLSNTVGMDVDLHRAEYESDEAYLKALAEIPEKVLEKKEELGLLMLERSVTKGYHLVFRRHPELSQEDNLRWASSLLGVEYDKGAKDITRVFFTTTASEEDLLYLDDELFDSSPSHDPTPTLPREGVCETESSMQEDTQGNAHDLTMVSNNSSPRGGQEGVSYQGIPYDQIIKKWWDLYNDGKEPEKSNRNTLTFELAVNLRHICGFDRELMKKVIPCYDGFAESEKMACIDSALNEKRTQMPRRLKEVLKCLSPSPLEKNEDTSEDDKALNTLAEGWNPPKLPKKIPRIMELLVSNYDPRFREMLLLAALPVLSAHASHFRATYLSGCITGPMQYVAIIGGSGKGKGNCTKLFKEMVEHTLDANDKNEWQKVHENNELRDKKANAKDRPPKYHPKLRLFETTSKSSILELQTNLGENGMLLGQFSEADGLSEASRTAYSNLSVVLRKGWDGDMHRQFYMADSNTCNTYTCVNISLLMAGTVRAILERMFNDNNCEGGLMQRFIPVLVPKTKRSFRPPRVNYLNETEKCERDALLMNLYQKDLALGDGTLLLNTPHTNQSIGEWFDELEERYNDGLLTEAEADLSHRCGEFMLRAAIPLIALYGKETKEIVDFSRWVGEMAHYTMCHIFGHRVQLDLNRAEELIENHTDMRKTAEPLLSKLPEVFTTQQLKEVRIQAGQSPEVKMILSRYCKNGKLEKVGKGVYRKAKGNIVTVTKKGNHNDNLNDGTST